MLLFIFLLEVISILRLKFCCYLSWDGFSGIGRDCIIVVLMSIFKEFPPSMETMSRSFKAVIGALEQDQVNIKSLWCCQFRHSCKLAVFRQPTERKPLHITSYLKSKFV